MSKLVRKPLNEQRLAVSNKKNFLWLSWKDSGHPGAGGAEVVMHEISKRLVQDGHSVTILTAKYPGASTHDQIDGATIIRVGTNRYLHSFQALVYYLRHLHNKYDVLVEVVNTAPYFGVFFRGKAKAVLLYHQLAREIWYHETKFPLNHIGYHVLENGATRLLSKAKATTITISDSTRKDLQQFGFKPSSMHIISEGIHIDPVQSLEDVSKFERPTLLSLGALRAMKRTIDQVKAFELAKLSIPELRLKVAGSSEGEYGTQVLKYIKASRFAGDIEYLGRVSHQEKNRLMQKSHALLVTSLKEGWGLVVSEANSQGTPAVVYNVDGLRDSVQHNKTGMVTEPNPEALSQAITLLFHDPLKYNELRQAGWQWSKQITFDKSYRDFKGALSL